MAPARQVSEWVCAEDTALCSAPRVPQPLPLKSGDQAIKMVMQEGPLPSSARLGPLSSGNGRFHRRPGWGGLRARAPSRAGVSKGPFWGPLEGPPHPDRPYVAASPHFATFKDSTRGCPHLQVSGSWGLLSHPSLSPIPPQLLTPRKIQPDLEFWVVPVCLCVCGFPSPHPSSLEREEQIGDPALGGSPVGKERRGKPLGRAHSPKFGTHSRGIPKEAQRIRTGQRARGMGGAKGAQGRSRGRGAGWGLGGARRRHLFVVLKRRALSSAELKSHNRQLFLPG